MECTCQHAKCLKPCVMSSRGASGLCISSALLQAELTSNGMVPVHWFPGKRASSSQLSCHIGHICHRTAAQWARQWQRPGNLVQICQMPGRSEGWHRRPDWCKRCNGGLGRSPPVLLRRERFYGSCTGSLRCPGFPSAEEMPVLRGNRLNSRKILPHCKDAARLLP